MNQVNDRKETHSKSRGGRPLGSRKKTSWGELLEEFERAMGQGFHCVAVENYMAARARQDHELVFKYDRLILNKLAPDLHHVELTDNRLADAQAAFEQAIADIQKR